MEALRRSILQIRQQLEVLTTSQKVAIALCAALVAGSLIWLVQYSTAPEMVPVLAQDLTLDQLDTALQTLKSQGIRAKQVGNRVYVPPLDRDRALLELSRAEALPKDTSLGFAELIADSDPFRPSDENKWRRQVALGNELARIISSGKDVRQARVIIQDKTQRRLGGLGNIRPTASVQVTMTGGKPLSQPVVDGLCRFVSGAVAGLEPHDVTVVDASTMRAFSVPDPENALGLGLLEEQKKNETHLAEKIQQALQSIPGVLVSVSVELDASKTKTQKQVWATPEVKTEETSSQVNESAKTPGETGVNPNVGVALSGQSAGTRSETEETHTDFFDQKPTEVTNVEKLPFTIKRATASIGIPRSFLIGIFRARFGEDVDVAKLEEDANYQKIRQSEVERVRSAVTKIVMTESPQDVEVDVFYDFAPDGTELRSYPGESTAVASTGGETIGTLRRYGPQAGLVVLALVSFLMMARLVRKSSDVVKSIMPPARRALAERESEEVLHVAGGAPVGKAAVSEGMLVGEEVDEDTLRFGQLGEQVTRMIENDPATAAEMVRRWARASDR